MPGTTVSHLLDKCLICDPARDYGVLGDMGLKIHPGGLLLLPSLSTGVWLVCVCHYVCVGSHYGTRPKVYISVCVCLSVCL